MNLTPIVTKNKRTSNALLRDISRRSSLNRMYEKKSLELLKKSIEERKKTYSALSKKDKEGGGLLGNILGGSLLQRLTRGRGPKGRGTGGIGRLGPRKPILPRGGGRLGLGRLGRLGRFGRVGPLAIVGTGLDFAGRLSGGQNIAQATIGAGGGLAGALAGGAKGAAIGTAIGGPVGTIIGGIGGSILGGFAGGGIADILTGASDNRRRQEIRQLEEATGTSKFSKSLDKFDNVIDNFEGSTTPLIKDYKANRNLIKEGGFRGFIRDQAPGLAIGTIVGSVLGTIGTIILQELAITAALAVMPVPGTRFVAVGRLLAKIPLFARFGRVLLRLRKFLTRLPVSKKLTNIAEKGFTGQGTLKLKLGKSKFLKSKGGEVIPRKATLDGFGNVRKTTKGNEVVTESISDMIENAAMRDRLGALGDASRPDKLVREALRTRNIESQAQQEAVQGFLDFIADNYTNVISGSPTPNLSIRKVKKLVKSPVGQAINKYKNLKSKFRGKKTIDTDQLNELLQDSANDFTKVFEVPIRKEEGGRVEAGTPYMVGEVGKELFVPDVSGDIIPNDQLGPAIIAMTSDPDTIMQSSGGGGNSGGGIVIVPASPYDVVAKYAQMTGLFTV